MLWYRHTSFIVFYLLFWILDLVVESVRMFCCDIPLFSDGLDCYSQYTVLSDYWTKGFERKRLFLILHGWWYIQASGTFRFVLSRTYVLRYCILEYKRSKSYSRMLEPMIGREYWLRGSDPINVMTIVIVQIIHIVGSYSAQWPIFRVLYSRS